MSVSNVGLWGNFEKLYKKKRKKWSTAQVAHDSYLENTFPNAQHSKIPVSLEWFSQIKWRKSTWAQK